MDNLESFRLEVRGWLEHNCPAGVRHTGRDLVEYGGRRDNFPNDDARLWCRLAVEKGWTVPAWPKEYGGAALPDAEARILAEEMEGLGIDPPLMSVGIIMLAPTLMEFATETQKRRFLPPIARGEIRWCQGYSEPGAGSDLASLRTRAVRQGDQYVVNGSKLWTSDADISDWIFCLVRTDPDAPKHDGISFLLIDMESPGVSVEPIELISGSSPFCQTFFDDVRVPVDNLIGIENQGWRIGTRLLQHERALLGRRSRGQARLESLADLARDPAAGSSGILSEPGIRDEIVQLEMDRICYEATTLRSADAARAGHSPGAETSMFKLYQTEMNQRLSDLRQRIVGCDGLGWEGQWFQERELRITREWLYGRARTILGGTSEIQMNVIAKRVLGLPD